MKISTRTVGLIGAALLSVTPALGQQIADPNFTVSIAQPAFPDRAGPVVAIDAAHHNFHTAADRYGPFAAILTADGYRVIPNRDPFTQTILDRFDVLVVANAGSDDASSWQLPTPSAFTAEEIEAVVAWVKRGGSLFLIADHMPAAGAAADLAAPFGFYFTNGYTSQPRLADWPGDLFTRADGTLLDHAIAMGRNQVEVIDSVVSFTGQAFQVADGVATVIRFGPQAVTLLPLDADADFSRETPRVPSPGWVHGATVEVGAGRVVAFGEAAMFSAQVAGSARRHMGLNHPRASRNQQLLLNILHWLSGLVDGQAP